MRADLSEKLERLKQILAGYDGAVLGYSGGVDSSFLAGVAKDVLGERLLAVTASSPLYPDEEIEGAKRLARELALNHLVLTTDEMDDDTFCANPPDRCYHCKKKLFGRLLELAQEKGYEAVLDGANVDDLGDFRPGMRAVRELNVHSPLKAAGLSKEEIRLLSREMHLPTWDKPSMACLASRFPYGERITRDGLKQVGEAEALVRKLVGGQVRVRHYNDLARIEVEPGRFLSLLKEAGQLTAALKKLGYKYVTLDLEGYRTGSMNEVLSEEEKQGGLAFN